MMSSAEPLPGYGVGDMLVLFEELCCLTTYPKEQMIKSAK
jgi:hypothetical protein